MNALIAVRRRATLARHGFSWHGHKSFKAAHIDFESWAQRPCLVDRLLNKEAR